MYIELVGVSKSQNGGFQNDRLLVGIKAVMEDYALIFHHMLCRRYKHHVSVDEATWIDLLSYSQ